MNVIIKTPLTQLLIRVYLFIIDCKILFHTKNYKYYKCYVRIGITMNYTNNIYYNFNIFIFITRNSRNNFIFCIQFLNVCIKKLDL